MSVDRRLRRLQFRRELLDRPSLVQPAQKAFDEETVWDRLSDGTRVGLRIIPLRNVSDLGQEQERYVVDVFQRREGSVADDHDFERQGNPLLAGIGGGWVKVPLLVF